MLQAIQRRFNIYVRLLPAAFFIYSDSNEKKHNRNWKIINYCIKVKYTESKILESAVDRKPIADRANRIKRNRTVYHVAAQTEKQYRNSCNGGSDLVFSERWNEYSNRYKRGS